MSGAREDIGVLSASEQAIGDNESHRLLRIQLDDSAHEAEAMRKWYEDKLRSFITSPPPWEYVQGYADWTARAALNRDRQERMGLLG